MSVPTRLRTLNDDQNLAIASDEPKLDVLTREINEALNRAGDYYLRAQHVADWWHCRWSGQTIDGRKHRVREDEDPFPWEGASDTRPQLMSKLIREHVMVTKFGFMQAKLAATAHRPFRNADEASSATRLMRYLVYVQMRTEIKRENPLFWSWIYGYGAAYLSPTWETIRRTEYVEFSIPMMDEFLQASGGTPGQSSAATGFGGGAQSAASAAPLSQLVSDIMAGDPAKDDMLAQVLMALSPLVTKRKAGKILRELRSTGFTYIPVPEVFKSKPKWLARRAVVDVLHPFEVSDVQGSPWVADREWVDEVDLRDRIETEDYDPDFVRELLKHKGQSDSPLGGLWRDRTALERNRVFGGLIPDYKNSVELFHVYYKTIEDGGAPCVYRTIFSPLVRARDPKKQLYASHEPHPYEHGEYPVISGRHELDDRPILSSRGIPEIAYTWEQEIKAQRDGRTDSTALIHRPFMIVPRTRENVIKNTPLPGAVLGVSRPNEVQFGPTPPQSGVPLQIEEQTLQEVRDWFPLFGQDVDPDKKNIYRQTVIDDRLSEMSDALEQTLKLAQQYLDEKTITAVVGPNARPFHISPEAIRGEFEITIAFNAKLLDQEYAMQQLDMMQKVLQFNTGGMAPMDKVFISAMRLVDPDLAEDVESQDPQKVSDQEIRGAKDEVNQAMNGIIPQPPMYGNHALRLKTIMETVQQPNVAQRLQQQPDSQQILKSIVQFYQNQIQQRTENPQIGRTLATAPLQGPGQPKQALLTQMTGAAA